MTRAVVVVVLGLISLAAGCGSGTGTVTLTEDSATTDTATDTTATTAPAVQMEVTPATATIQVGQFQQFGAKALDAAGVVVQTTGFTWQSSAASVATVDANGLAQAVAAGTASITATLGALTNSASLTVTTPPASPPPCGARFCSPVFYAVGLAPQAVLVSDFNGDGRPDLATVNADGNTVSILLQQGPGTGGAFGQPASATLKTGGLPSGLTAGQFDGLSGVDLATVNPGTKDLSLFFGNGSGGFTGPFTVGTGGVPFGVAAGRLNADGLDDLVVADLAGGLLVVLATGGGGFDPPRLVSTGGTGPAAAAVRDLNGDGRLDAAVAHGGSHSIAALLGDGLGSLASVAGSPFATGGSRPVALALGAFRTGTATSDLAAALRDSDEVAVLLGSGTGQGTFGASTRIALTAGDRPSGLAAGALNPATDSHLDLAVTLPGSGSSSGRVRLLGGSGAGAFTTLEDITVALNPKGVAVSDLNGDGRPDLIVTNAGSHSVAVILATPP